MNLLVRADASGEMGSGHVMRTLALSQAWQDSGGSVTFAVAQIPELLRSRLSREGMGIVQVDALPGGPEDAAATRSLASDLGAEWIVIDGYHLGSAYRAAVRSPGARILCVDDCADLGPYDVDLVVNQNSHAHASLYGAAGSDAVLVGSSYALLRREFREARASERHTPAKARRLLVSLGGADPRGLTLRVARALSSLQDLEEVSLVLGPAAGRQDELERLANGRPGYRIERVPEDMARLMLRANLAVTAGGSTCYETACLGLPSIAVVVAENQRGIVRHLTEIGVLTGMDETEATEENLRQRIGALVDDPERRGRMGVRGRELVDGCGAARVVGRMRAVGRRSQEATT